MTSPFTPISSNPTIYPSVGSAGSRLSAATLRDWMQQCRQSTLALFATVDEEIFCRQAHPDFSPIGWHLGHIAYTEALWLLEKTAGLPPQFLDYRCLFAADSLPKTERIHLPTLADVQSYLAQVRVQVFEYLEMAALEQQERLWRWLLQHESQHCETIAIVLAIQNSQKHPVPLQAASVSQAYSSLDSDRSAMVKIPAGFFDQGNASLDALDNERPIHAVALPTYWIDRTPVTCGQYRQFMEADGYHCDRWWSPQGWQWLQTHPVTHPCYWHDEAAWDDHPVCGVSWYEAEAYANFVGKRLPTEAEWEKAACWSASQHQSFLYPWGNTPPTSNHANIFHTIGHTTPVHAYPIGKSPVGCLDMLGNVWEWTASWFSGYEGFEPYPYRGYSQAYFDQQHRVLKGGSWATRPWALRAAFRNWYYPQIREIFSGFRCAAD